MSRSPSVSSLTFDSWAEPSAHGGAPPPRWGAAVVFSILAHALVLAAAGRIAWTRLEPPPAALTEFVWIGVLPVPGPVPVESPQAAPVESVPVEREQVPPKPAIVVELPREVAAEQPASSAPTPPADAPAQTRDAIAEPRPVRGTDWAEERKRAIAAALERQARDSEFSAFSLDDSTAGRPPPPEPKPSRSIFDSRASGGGRAFMQPGRARTKFGHRVGELCNALTGGFGLFGMAFCASADNEPSGLFPEVLPEWLKRMPECVETRPLGPLLAEPSEFPTIKCRMVPKDDGTGERLSPDVTP